MKNYSMLLPALFCLALAGLFYGILVLEEQYYAGARLVGATFYWNDVWKTADSREQRVVLLLDGERAQRMVNGHLDGHQRGDHIEVWLNQTSTNDQVHLGGREKPKQEQLTWGSLIALAVAGALACIWAGTVRECKFLRLGTPEAPRLPTAGPRHDW